MRFYGTHTVDIAAELTDKDTSTPAAHGDHWAVLAAPVGDRRPGRISYLKRRYGLDRTLFDTMPGAQTWCGLGVLAHNNVKIAALVQASGPRPASSPRLDPVRPARPAPCPAPDTAATGRPPPDPLFDHTAA